MPLAAGTRLGPYQIVAPLGAGGMGEVYRAHDSRLGRDVAVKVLPEQRSASAEVRARFEREARTASALNHPHICVLHDIGREGDTDYLVMELVEGETLAERVRRGPLPPAEVIRLGMQIADALGRAHRAGIIHRDLKPGNVMIGRSGAKLMDFGLARAGAGAALPASDPALTASPTVTRPLTAAGTLVGTFQYMAPEQLEGREADARSDVWALGCVLYEMATGRRAFDGTTHASVISAIMKDEPPPLIDAASLPPPALERVVRACLAKDPERRWQEAHDVAIALAIAAEAPAAPPAARTGPRERRFVLTAEHVRQLGERNPRLVGHPVTFIDNHADSDTLVVYVHGIGGDSGRFESIVRTQTERAIAVDLVGFGAGERTRPVLGIDDHSRVLRFLLRELVAECRPRHLLLVGHSSGADQLMRMVHDPDGTGGVEVAALIGLSPNVSLETCFASRLYARIDASDPGTTLAILKSLGKDIPSLDAWLTVQSYLSQTFLKLGTDVEPLRRYAADLVAPFERPGDPLADWYRTAREQIGFVRLVFAREEQAIVEALIARHLERNVLGDKFTVDSLVIEPVHHLGLLAPDVVTRHVRDAIAAIGR